MLARTASGDTVHSRKSDIPPKSGQGRVAASLIVTSQPGNDLVVLTHPMTIARCSRRCHQTESIGWSIMSICECLCLMTRECPCDGSNDYEVAGAMSPHFALRPDTGDREIAWRTCPSEFNHRRLGHHVDGRASARRADFRYPKLLSTSRTSLHVRNNRPVRCL